MWHTWIPFSSFRTPRPCWDGICSSWTPTPAVQTLAPRLEEGTVGGCAADTASSWLDHRLERVGAWSSALSSRQPAGQRREGRSRAAVSVTGAASCSGGEGEGLGPGKRLSRFQARRPSAEAAGSQQLQGVAGGEAGCAPLPSAGAAAPPASSLPEEPLQKRISSSAEPTSAQRFLGPSKSRVLASRCSVS